MPVSSQAASIAAPSRYRASYFLLTQKKVTKENNPIAASAIMKPLSSA